MEMSEVIKKADHLGPIFSLLFIDHREAFNCSICSSPKESFRDNIIHKQKAWANAQTFLC